MHNLFFNLLMIIYIIIFFYMTPAKTFSLYFEVTLFLNLMHAFLYSKSNVIVILHVCNKLLMVPSTASIF